MCTLIPLPKLNSPMYVVAEAIVQVLAKKVLVIYPSRFDILTVSCIVNLMQFFVVYAANKTI